MSLLAAVYLSDCISLALLPYFSNSNATGICSSVVEWFTKTWFFSFFVWNLCVARRKNTTVAKTITASAKTILKHIVHWAQWQSRSNVMDFTSLLLQNYCFIVFRAFVPLEAPPGQNSTQWEKVQYLFEELGSSRKYNLFRKYLDLTFIVVVTAIPLFNQFIPPYPFISHGHYSLNVKSLAPIHFLTLYNSLLLFVIFFILFHYYPATLISVKSNVCLDWMESKLDGAQLQTKQKDTSCLKYLWSNAG